MNGKIIKHGSEKIARTLVNTLSEHSIRSEMTLKDYRNIQRCIARTMWSVVERLWSKTTDVRPVGAFEHHEDTVRSVHDIVQLDWLSEQFGTPRVMIVVFDEYDEVGNRPIPNTMIVEVGGERVASFEEVL